ARLRRELHRRRASRKPRGRPRRPQARNGLRLRAGTRRLRATGRFVMLRRKSAGRNGSTGRTCWRRLSEQTCWKRLLAPLALLAAIFALQTFAAFNPRLVERYYSRGLFHFVARALSFSRFA